MPNSQLHYASTTPPQGESRGRAAAALVGAAIVAVGTAASAGAALPSPSVSAAGTASATSAPPATSPSRVAARGAGWLARQLSAGHGHLGAPGAPDVNDTAYAVVALNAAGGHQSQARSSLGYLKTHLSSLKSADGSDNAASLAYFILAGASGGADVARFGGSKPVNDLPARLLASVRSGGVDAGLAGTEDPTYDGAFRQGLALAALSASKIPMTDAKVRSALTWLERQQCSDGLWTAYRADTSRPCGPVDPDTFTGPDTNSTSLAVQGLHAYGVSSKRSLVLRSLHAVQSADGGFPYLAAPGQDSDPNSTALVIQAIIAEGQQPAWRTWRVEGATPDDALASYQIGKGGPAADRGAFFYSVGDRTPSVIATVQAVPAAAGRTLPVLP